MKNNVLSGTVEIIMHGGIGRMRRAIMVFGCTLEDGSQITTEDYTSVKVFPDKSIEVTKADGSKEFIEGTWISYTPRFN